MWLPMIKPTQQCLPRILWCGILFAISGPCAADAADYPPSEVLFVGSPDRHDLATRTVTITITYKPTLVPGVSPYSLSGCYGQTGVDQRGGHPFGTEQDYATPSSVDLAQLTVASCLNACVTMPKEPSGKDKFEFAGLKDGSECYCFRKLDKHTVELSPNNCTTACPGDPNLSCGGPDALVVYSLGTGSEAAESTASSMEISRHTSHTYPLRNFASRPSSHSSVSPHPLPSEVNGGGDESSGNAGQPSSRTPKARTIAVISSSTSGAVLLSVIVYFGLRAYKRRRRQQDARVADILTKSTTTSEHTLAGPPRSPSRGRTLTRASRPPPLTSLQTPGFGSEGWGGRTRAALLTTSRGQIPGSLPPALSTTDLPPARALEEDEDGDGGHSSAVQWRPGNRAGTAACPSPSSSWGALAPTNPTAAAQPASLGDRAWHRRRLSTPYAPPTIPLPPTPPIVRQKKKLAAATAAGHPPLAPPASGGRSLTAPLRPDRKNSFETSSPARQPPHGQDGGAAPRHLEFLPSTRYLAGREPTIPVLPPITADERMDLAPEGWKAGEASPATTVDTDILYSPPAPHGGGGGGGGPGNEAKEQHGRPS